MFTGERAHKITIERYTAGAENAYGEASKTWAALATEWAGIVWGRGTERRAASREGASTPATFFVMSNAATRSVTRLDRISYDGATWDISGAVPSGADQIEITATRGD